MYKDKKDKGGFLKELSEIIALEEEFLIRGICVYLLKDENNFF